jgi:hypothetical protein
LYDEIASGNGGFAFPINIFPVHMSGSEKVLINRLLAIPEYKERYYREFCRLLDNNFTAERIFPLIEKYGVLIRTDIQADNNYLWSQAEFELDLDQGSEILPGLKKFIATQVVTMNDELEQVYGCDNASSSLQSLDISINEFMASNDSLSGISDAAGDFADWIELYNNTEEQIDLSNAYLTDNVGKPQKWSFPIGAKIEANSYLIIWTDNDEGEEVLHANFKLSKEGGFIMLMDDNLVLDSLSYGTQETNVTLSRIPNGLGEFIAKPPTFNKSNSSPSNTQELNKYFVNVYPNPAQSYINIDFESGGKRSVILSNGFGKSILTRDIFGDKNLVQLPNLMTGIYFLTIKNDNEMLASKKIIILP